MTVPAGGDFLGLIFLGKATSFTWVWPKASLSRPDDEHRTGSSRCCVVPSTSGSHTALYEIHMVRGCGGCRAPKGLHRFDSASDPPGKF